MTKPKNTRKSFHGVCRLARWVPIEQLLDLDPDSTTSRWDRKLGREVFAVQCDFETADTAAFDAHMADVHDRKLGTYQGPRSDSGWTRRFPRDVKRGQGMWRTPPRKELDPDDWIDRTDELGRPVTLELLDEPAQDVA